MCALLITDKEILNKPGEKKLEESHVFKGIFKSPTVDLM